MLILSVKDNFGNNCNDYMAEDTGNSLREIASSMEADSFHPWSRPFYNAFSPEEIYETAKGGGDSVRQNYERTNEERARSKYKSARWKTSLFLL